jgi:sporulation protein YlmC with PRC-barrel domain
VQRTSQTLEGKRHETDTDSYYALHACEHRLIRSRTDDVDQSTDALMATIPGDARTVTDWYKQNVYDPSNNKIGEIEDVLVDKSGKVSAVIIAVGGFLGMDKKDVAAPFSLIHATMKDNKWWLTMNTTKDALKGAPGYRYDKK